MNPARMALMATSIPDYPAPSAAPAVGRTGRSGRGGRNGWRQAKNGRNGWRSNAGGASGENKQALGKIRDLGNRWIDETGGEGEGTATPEEAAPVTNFRAAKRKWGNDADLVRAIWDRAEGEVCWSVLIRDLRALNITLFWYNPMWASRIRSDRSPSGRTRKIRPPSRSPPRPPQSIP